MGKGLKARSRKDATGEAKSYVAADWDALGRRLRIRLESEPNPALDVAANG